MPDTDSIKTNADNAMEASGLQHGTRDTGAVVINWHFKHVDGVANVIANADGTYLFSGDYKQKEPGKDLDIAIALRSRLGGIVIVHFVGDASNGATWSIQGKSDSLRDNFQTFGEHDWSGEYHLPLSAEGRAKLYEAQERKNANRERQN